MCWIRSAILNLIPQKQKNSFLIKLVKLNLFRILFSFYSGILLFYLFIKEKLQICYNNVLNFTAKWINYIQNWKSLLSKFIKIVIISWIYRKYQIYILCFTYIFLYIYPMQIYGSISTNTFSMEGISEWFWFYISISSRNLIWNWPFWIWEAK